MANFSVVILAALVVLSCNNAATTQGPRIRPQGASAYGHADFTTALESGSSCGALFEIRNSVRRNDPNRAASMNDALGAVGCTSSSSTRVAPTEPTPGTSGTPAPANYVATYSQTYSLCLGAGGERLFLEAKTQDPRKAAEWRAEVYVAGPFRQGASDGCYDALAGNPRRY